MEENKIILERDGKEFTFYKMAEFDSILTKKDYIIYTDNEYTDGKLNVYCNVINEKDGKIVFEKLDEVDQKEFEKALKELIKVGK